MKTKIEQFRKRHGLKPADLAKASGLSAEMIYLIRKGHNTTLETAKKLAAGASALLGREVSLEELFDLSVPKKRRVA